MKSLKRENQRLLTQYELMGKDLETIEKVMAEIIFFIFFIILFNFYIK